MLKKSLPFGLHQGVCFKGPTLEELSGSPAWQPLLTLQLSAVPQSGQTC